MFLKTINYLSEISITNISAKYLNEIIFETKLSKTDKNVLKHETKLSKNNKNVSCDNKISERKICAKNTSEISMGNNYQRENHKE